MDIWELRFNDGRGASFYTNEDVTADIGQNQLVRTFPVAATVFEGTALRDATRCFQEGEIVTLTAHMGAVSFAVRYET